MKKSINYILLFFLGFTLLYLLNSCANSKKLAYFSNIPRDSSAIVDPFNIQTIITKNDVLQINISTMDVNDNALLNNTPATVVNVPGGLNGLLVDDSGSIKLPILGTVKAEGLTKSQLAAYISNQLLTKKIAIDPIVTVRIINYKITVLGEVAHPGVIAVPNERITLPEALGQAGDLTVYGKRDDVLLIREVGGKRTYKRFSLNKDQMFDKDIYNLQNQDIIYVGPSNARAATTDRSTQYLSVGISIVSLLLVIYSVFRK